MYTTGADGILEPMSRRSVIILLLTLMTAPVLAQERPSRDERDEAPERTERTQPQRSPEKDIEESWMKELQSPPAEGSEQPAAGQGDDQAAEAQPEPGAIFAEDAAPSFVGLLFRFVLIAGLMGFGLYGFVRFFKKRAGILHPEEGPVEVLASVPLMPGKFLQIVDLAGQLLVLGVSEQGVRLVYEIESATTAERIRLWHESRPKPSATSLLDVIQKAIKQGEFRFWGGERVSDRPDFMDLLRGEKTTDEVPPDRLKDLLQMQNRKIRRSTRKEQEES